MKNKRVLLHLVDLTSFYTTSKTVVRQRRLTTFGCYNRLLYVWYDSSKTKVSYYIKLLKQPKIRFFDVVGRVSIKSIFLLSLIYVLLYILYIDIVIIIGECSKTKVSYYCLTTHIIFLLYVVITAECSKTLFGGKKWF